MKLTSFLRIGAIILALTACLPSGVQAATTEPQPNLSIGKIATNFSNSDRVLHVDIPVTNQEVASISGISFLTELLQTDTYSTYGQEPILTQVDNTVYSFAPKETKTITTSLSVPGGVAAGSYIVHVVAQTPSGYPATSGVASTSLEGNGTLLTFRSENSRIHYGEVTTDAQSGALLAAGVTATAELTVVNPTGATVTASPYFQAYAYGKLPGVKPTSETGKEVFTIRPLEKKIVTFTLPVPDKAASYLTDVVLRDDQGRDVSAHEQYRVVRAGEAGRILTLRTEEKKYLLHAGVTSQITVVGPPDLSTLSSVTVKVTAKQGSKIITTSEQKINSLADTPQDASVLYTLRRQLIGMEDISVSVELIGPDGKVLDTATDTIPIAATRILTSLQAALAGFILLLLLISIAWVGRKKFRHHHLKYVAQMVPVMFAAAAVALAMSSPTFSATNTDLTCAPTSAQNCVTPGIAIYVDTNQESQWCAQRGDNNCYVADPKPSSLSTIVTRPTEEKVVSCPTGVTATCIKKYPDDYTTSYWSFDGVTTSKNYVNNEGVSYCTQYTDNGGSKGCTYSWQNWSGWAASVSRVGGATTGYNTLLPQYITNPRTVYDPTDTSVRVMLGSQTIQTGTSTTIGFSVTSSYATNAPMGASSGIAAGPTSPPTWQSVLSAAGCVNVDSGSSSSSSSDLPTGPYSSTSASYARTVYYSVYANSVGTGTVTQSLDYSANYASYSNLCWTCKAGTQQVHEQHETQLQCVAPAAAAGSSVACDATDTSKKLYVWLPSSSGGQTLYPVDSSGDACTNLEAKLASLDSSLVPQQCSYDATNKTFKLRSQRKGSQTFSVDTSQGGVTVNPMNKDQVTALLSNNSILSKASQLRPFGINSGTYLGSQFLTSSGWASGGGWTGYWYSVSNSSFKNNANNVKSLTQNAPAAVGTKYQISYTVSGRTAGSFVLSFGGQTTTSAANGNVTFSPTATTVDSLVITPTSDFNGTINALSIVPIVSASPTITAGNSGHTLTLAPSFGSCNQVVTGTDASGAFTFGNDDLVSATANPPVCSTYLCSITYDSTGNPSGVTCDYTLQARNNYAALCLKPADATTLSGTTGTTAATPQPQTYTSSNTDSGRSSIATANPDAQSGTTSGNIPPGYNYGKGSIKITP